MYALQYRTTRSDETQTWGELESAEKCIEQIAEFIRLGGIYMLLKKKPEQILFVPMQMVESITCFELDKTSEP